MTSLRYLCPTCKQVLRPDPSAPPLPRDRHEWVTPIGQSYHANCQAVADGCYICTEIHNSGSTQHLARETSPAELWLPQDYHLRPSGGHGFSLSVCPSGASDPDEWSYFKLFEATGKLRILTLGKTPLTEVEAETSGLSPLPRLEESTSSTSTLDVARRWYNECHASHKRCKQMPTSRGDWLPTRLIEVGPSSEDAWRLVVSAEDLTRGPVPRYITLSYRWGPNPAILLTSSTLDSFRRGMRISDLPQTFKDLTTVARHFGVCHLWIDSLCIIQDSHEDWAAEAPLMSHVYANSTCTVAASASKGPEGGLFRSRRTDSLPGAIETNPSSPPSGPSAPKVHVIYHERYWKRQLSGSELHLRGWVFQERILSPRVLYYTKTQILWECLEGHRAEAFPNAQLPEKTLKSAQELLALRSPSWGRSGDTPTWVLERWKQMLEEYTKCELTRPSDRLIAFAGIAGLFQEITGDEYMAGLWKSQILECLLWKAETSTLAARPDEYRVPSWSWASIDSPVSHHSALRQDSEDRDFYQLEVVDMSATARRGREMAEVIDGYLKLRGTILRTKFVTGRWKDHFIFTTPIDEAGGTWDFEAEVFPDTESDVLDPKGETFILLHSVKETLGLVNLTGLMVKAVQGSPDTFQRAGLVHSHCLASDIKGFWDHRAQTSRDITLV